MKQFIPRFMLGLAGLLLLAHGIIPHHHHDLNSKSCNYELYVNLNSFPQIVAETCSCSNHHEKGEQVCHLSVKTLVKAANTLIVALVANLLHLITPEYKIVRSLKALQLHLEPVFVDYKPSRAPPIA
jgi:hypothetical protein